MNEVLQVSDLLLLNVHCTRNTSLQQTQQLAAAAAPRQLASFTFVPCPYSFGRTASSRLARAEMAPCLKIWIHGSKLCLGMVTGPKSSLRDESSLSPLQHWTPSPFLPVAKSLAPTDSPHPALPEAASDPRLDARSDWLAPRRVQILCSCVFDF